MFHKLERVSLQVERERERLCEVVGAGDIFFSLLLFQAAAAAASSFLMSSLATPTTSQRARHL